MKIIKTMIVIASLFAISGAALLQLILLLAHSMHPSRSYKHIIS